MSADFDSTHSPGGRPPDDGLDADLLAAAEAVADGLWSASASPGALPDEARQYLNLINRIARVHATVPLDEAVGAGAPAARSSDSMADAMSRVPASTGRPDLSTARRWGPLFVLERVGGGSFGEVYRAWDPALDREVALKLLRFRENSREADAVVREGHLLASINHPNVIRVFGAANIDGEVGIWMEFLRGRTLEQIVQNDGTMSAEEATVVARQLCAAIGAVHECGLLHQDIKPANVMRVERGRYVLIDFGASAVVTGFNGEKRRTGTPLFMAPEVIRLGAASIQSDVYSLGVLLFNLVSASYPVYGRDLETLTAVHQSGRRVSLGNVRPDLPQEFVALVDRMVSPHILDRPERARDVLDALLTPAPTPSLVQPSLKFALTLISAGSLVLVGLTVLGFVTSAAFRAGLPVADSPTEWPVWGIRSLVAPAVFVVMIAVTVLICRAAVALVLSAVRRWSGGPASSRSVHSVLERLATNPTALQLVLLLQVVTLISVLWSFRALFAAVNVFVQRLPSGDLTILGPGNSLYHQAFRQVLTLHLLVFGAAWTGAVVRRSEAASAECRFLRLGGVATALLTIMTLTLPYRIVYQNAGERALLGDAVCYIAGAQRSDLVLFCPREHPRVRLVAPTSSELKRTGLSENIFTPLGDARSAFGQVK